MASSSGTSSGSTLLQNSGSEEDLQALMDQRKRKRMISNRESARRSRMKKQKHLDELMGQVCELRKENNQIISSVNSTTQQFFTIESENSVLRAQVGELSHRLQSLNEIVSFLNVSHCGFGEDADFGAAEPIDSLFNHSWNLQLLNLPIMASPDMFQC